MDKKICVCIIASGLALLPAGCATMSGAAAEIKTDAPIQQEKTAPEIEAGAVIVRAKRLTRLEVLKKEAVKKNNKQTVEIAAGAAAAVAAYIGTTAYFNIKNEKPNDLAGLAVTAASAYAAAFIAGALYDLFADK